MMDKVFQFGKKLVDILVAPFEEVGTNEGLTEKNLRAVLEARGVSDFLLYRYYEEIGDAGIYTLADGRKGFILRIYPPGFLGDEMEEQISTLLGSIETNGTVMQFITFSSQNIEFEIDEFEKQHPCQVNIKNRDALKEMVANRAKYLRRWTRESFAKGMDLRVRNFVNLVCVLFPEGTDTDIVISEYEAIRAMLENYGAENFPASQLITLLREFFHNDKKPQEWMSGYDESMAMNHQIVSGGVEVSTNHKEWKKNFVVNKQSYVTVLTTKQYPHFIDLDDFNELFFDRWGQEIKVPIGGPFIVSLTVVIEDVERRKNQTLSKLKHDLSELRRYPIKVIDKRPDLKERLQEVKAQMRNLTLENEVPLRSMWSLILFDTDQKKLTQSIARIKNRFRTKKDWHLIEESFNNIAFMEALFSLPLQYHRVVDEGLKRFRTLFKSNNAGITPLISDTRGGGRKLFPLIGRTGQLQWFDPYEADNYNIACMGSSGSGKSFTLSDFTTMSLAANGKIRIIDALASYDKTAEMVGGKYIDFKEGQDISLNFFTNIDTKKDEHGNEVLIEDPDNPGKKYPVIAEEEFATIIPLIGMMVGIDIASTASKRAEDINTSTKKKYLAARFEEAINAAFRSAGRNAGMYEVREYIRELRDLEKSSGNEEQASLLQDVYVALYPYGDPTGKYFNYFNRPNNLDLDSDYIVFELTRLKEKGELFPIVLMAIANQIVREFFHETDRYKVLMIDEFWEHRDNKIVMNFTEELARKIRKAKGSLVTITQGLADYFVNDSIAALYENCSWKFMLKQNNSSIDQALKSSRLSIPSLYVKLIKTVQMRFGLFGEFAIMSDKSFMISRLKVDPVSEWLYTTHPTMKDRIKDVMNRFGLTKVHAAKYCAFKSEDPTASDEDVLRKIGAISEGEAKRLEKEKKEREEKIRKAIESAISDGHMRVYRRYIYNVSMNPYAAEYEIKLELSDGMLVDAEEYLDVARRTGQLFELEAEILKRICILQDDSLFSVNVSFETFMENRFIDLVASLVDDFELKKRMIIEVPIKRASKEMEERVAEQIQALQSKGIYVANDGVDMDMPISLISIDTDYVKIDGSIASCFGDGVTEAFVQMVVVLSKSKGMKTIMEGIERKEEIELAKALGIEYFEGNCIDVPKEIEEALA